jgi:N-formylglutamate deformylase
MSDIFSLIQRNSPLILSQPHVGQNIPGKISEKLTAAAQQIPDTDWYIDQLYAPIAEDLSATVVTAKMSRYVIDLNRDPSGASLYPGQSVTELCPTTLFDGDPLYKDAQAPSEPEVQERKDLYWRPYHDALVSEIQRIKNLHGFALLYDCHSIRSVIPRFFDGRLPTMNVGTNNGQTIAPTLTSELKKTLALHHSYSSILNGRFKGGFITRNYGNPDQHIHAVQMELTQIDYMNEELPFVFDEEKAVALRPHLQAILATMLEWADGHYC